MPATEDDYKNLLDWIDDKILKLHKDIHECQKYITEEEKVLKDHQNTLSLKETIESYNIFLSYNFFGNCNSTSSDLKIRSYNKDIRDFTKTITELNTLKYAVEERYRNHIGDSMV